MGEIFIITEQQTLVPLAERQYESEDLLQTLLARYPSLLAGDQMNPEAPRRWMLVNREAEVPGAENGSGRWSLDHLFLDQEGVPTLVEVKRSNDTRIRREVVGQMLDYAANGIKYWPVESIQGFFEQRCEKDGLDSEAALDKLTGVAGSWDQFWAKVKLNLQAGRIRMLFVADEIPDELRRVVEFLNEQMDPAEVLAVEIKQFAGQSLKTLVPRLIGQTSEAGERKRVSGTRARRQWDETSYLTEMEAKHGAEAARIARRLLDWTRRNAIDPVWGQGNQNGSFNPTLRLAKLNYCLFSVYHLGARGKPSVEIGFQYCADKPPFQERAIRLDWLRRLNGIPGVAISDDAIDRRPNFPLLALEREEAMVAFLSAIDWVVDQAKQVSHSAKLP